MDETDLGDECEYVAAVESGVMPIEVLADWLEERGDERAVGLRWLIACGKLPVSMGSDWRWKNLEQDLDGLPPAVRAGMRVRDEPYHSLTDALLDAALGVSRCIAREPIDEWMELVTAYERYESAAGGVYKWIEQVCGAERPGLQWLRTLEIAPVPDGGAKSWLWHREVAPGWPFRGGSAVPGSVFDELREGQRREQGLFRFGYVSRCYPS